MNLIENIFTAILQQGIILHKSRVSRTVYHLKIKSESFKKVDPDMGDFLRILVGRGKENLSFRDKVRSYSIWALDKEKCEADIAVTTFGHGPGAQWAADCNTGDTVYFNPHKGKFRISSIADEHVFIGDLSTLSTYYEFSRSLKTKKLHAVIYSQSEEDLFDDLDGNRPYELLCLPQNPINEVLTRLTSIKQKLTTNAAFYIAGDSRICVALTKTIRNEWQWPSQKVIVKPYWNPQKRGLE